MSLLLTIRQQGVVREDGIPDDSETVSSPRSASRRARFIDHLLALGILTAPSFVDLVRSSRDGSANAAERLSGYAAPSPAGTGLSAPETVHWAITYRCEARCPDCYVRTNSRHFAAELDTREALRVIDVLAEWGVFQVAIGGGEPLLRQDLPTLADHARQSGLVVHVTTGYHRLSFNTLKALVRGVTVLQVGVKHEALLQNPETETALLSRFAHAAEDQGLRVGANLMLSNTVLANLERLIAILARAGLRSIAVLRYKPPAEPARWERENPSREVMGGLEQLLPEIAARHPRVAFRIDCAASFVQRRLRPEAARFRGIRGCVAADRILALAPDGSMFPCSQLIHPDLRAGSILSDNPGAIWTDSTIMRKYRLFREGCAFKESECHACPAQSHCGGCRVFARDAWGAEPECPGGRRPKRTEVLR